MISSNVNQFKFTTIALFNSLFCVAIIQMRNLEPLQHASDVILE